MKNAFLAVVIVGLVGVVAGGFVYVANLKNDTRDSSLTTDGEQRGGVLDLRERGLTSVGSDVYNKKNITELILSGNQLKSLPSEMGRMTDLTVLRLDHNALEGSLIAEIRHMSRLRVLDASANNMTGVPAEIGQLTRLESLDYSDNKITAFPNEIRNLKNNLKELKLTGNPIGQDEISRLKSDLPNTTIIF